MKWKEIIKIVLVIVCVIIIGYAFEWYGIIGLLLFVLAFVGYRIWSKKDMFVTGMRNIESMIWGKPLEKKYWEDKEFKNHKIKVTIGKGKYYSKEFIPTLLWGLALLFLFVVIIRWVMI